MFLFIFEFFGTTELMVIALVALIIFGPRKLPELGRSLGKSLGEFKRASEDFKRTWEREVEVEKIERQMRIEEIAQAGPEASTGQGGAPSTMDEAGAGTEAAAAPAREVSVEDRTVARDSAISPSREGQEAGAFDGEGAGSARGARQATDTTDAFEPTAKHDWL